MSRILIVEDSVDLLEMLEVLFNGEGYDVILATDGQAGIEALKDGPPVDAILSDINMPGMDGITFFRTLRASGVVTPFIFLTGHASEADSRLKPIVAEHGIQVLQKPVDSDELLLTVRARLHSGG